MIKARKVVTISWKQNCENKERLNLKFFDNLFIILQKNVYIYTTGGVHMIPDLLWIAWL